MSNTPENLKYTKEHEWALIENGVAVIGITDFAQTSLGDIVFVELPEVGTKLTEGATFGVVESIKSVSDLYSPLTGEVVEVNAGLTDAPENCNSAPYESWMIKIKIENDSEVDKLLGPEDYVALCEE
ncbi:MAG: glycine cleavage system protein GcvH [Bacteriovoracaceae bacterium]